MRFEHSGKIYRIAFQHAPSRVWADHVEHAVSLNFDGLLWCDTCGLQLSHLPKAARIRTTTCTISEEVTESAGGETQSFALRLVLSGTARPNLAAGDRFEREKGRQVSLANALAELLPPTLATREFRAAAWAAYLGRKRNKSVGAG